MLGNTSRTDLPPLTPRDRALAAWENATVQTLAPRLTPAEYERLWAAVLEARGAAVPSETFAAAMLETGRALTPEVFGLLAQAITNLIIVSASFATPTLSTE